MRPRRQSAIDPDHTTCPLWRKRDAIRSNPLTQRRAFSMEAVQRCIARVLSVIVAIALALTTASSQDFPTKPITLVVGFAPGGFADGFARLISERLATKLGQPVV